MSWLRPIDQWFADHVFVHQALHRRYARRLTGDATEAEDIVQEAYARLFSLGDWASIVNPHAFTMRIIHNVATDRFRRAEVVRIDRGAALQALELEDEAPLPDSVAHHRTELRRLAALLDTLPDRCHEAVRLRRIEGLPPGEVAEKMGISVSTVEKHLTKGLRLLIERMAVDVPPQGTGYAREWKSIRRRSKR